MTDAAQKIAERVPMPEFDDWFSPNDCGAKAVWIEEAERKAKAYGLAVAAEALMVSSAQSPDALKLSDHALARMPMRCGVAVARLPAHRARVSEIEDAVASGRMNARQCFTQMRQLITTPPASAPSTAVEVTEFPKKITRTVCDGCPNLRTEIWEDHLENGETDIGTEAKCAKAGRKIGNYWFVGSSTPDWCPLTAALQEKDE